MAVSSSRSRTHRPGPQSGGALQAICIAANNGINHLLRPELPTRQAVDPGTGPRGHDRAVPSWMYASPTKRRMRRTSSASVGGLGDHRRAVKRTTGASPSSWRIRFGFAVAITLRTSISASDNSWAGMLYDGERYCFSRSTCTSWTGWAATLRRRVDLRPAQREGHPGGHRVRGGGFGPEALLVGGLQPGHHNRVEEAGRRRRLRPGAALTDPKTGGAIIPGQAIEQRRAQTRPPLFQVAFSVGSRYRLL